MWPSKKNKSILSILRDRELNNKTSPYFSSIDVISRLIRNKSETSIYNNYWKKKCRRSINYDCGYLYFSDYIQFCSIYNENNTPPPMFNMQKSRAKMKVSDVISYSIPVYKNVDDTCNCELPGCTCLSQYLLSVSEDNWLCQRLTVNGKIMREIYVNQIGQKFRFKYCDWDVYGDRFVLTSTLNPDLFKSVDKMKSDVVVTLAIFTVFPLEFLALLEIKRSVFGETCTAANISDQHLILGKSSYQVHIYSFEDFLKEGNLIPYKLGDNFELEGTIGSYPTGLPLNFTYQTAPPLLFNVQCYGQIIRFGGYPYHYITASKTNCNLFTLKRIESNIPTTGGTLMSFTSCNDDVDALTFHPDHSNRLIFRTNRTVDCYKLTIEDGISKISKMFSMGFFEKKCDFQAASSRGRKIKYREVSYDECCIFSTDYASDLDLFAILGVEQHAPAIGFVRLYDSTTGEELRTVRLREHISDIFFYQLFVDMGAIIIIERKTTLLYNVYVYNL